MTTRLAYPNRKKTIKTELTTYLNFNEHCNFCVLSFQTRAELKAHVLTHFKKKTCLETQKTLLLIVDEWFELHTDHGCGVEQGDSDYVSDAVHVRINEQLVKREAGLDEILGNDDGDIVHDETSNVDTKIESESDTDMFFDGNSTDRTWASSTKSIANFKMKAKKTKSKRLQTDNDSLPAEKQTKEIMTATSKTRIRNRSSVTTKPVIPKSKRTKCRICKLNFAKDALIFHLQSKHSPKIDPIPTCETCGKTFSTPGNLRSHQYLHAERGRYICSYCGKEFVRNANLKEHINLHTGARPFVCTICKKTFHRETLLRNHTRVHTGERKYRCNIENCERAYMFDIDLKRHKFSAHGIYSKKHPCFICSKVFSENKLLKKHLESHDAH